MTHFDPPTPMIIPAIGIMINFIFIELVSRHKPQTILDIGLFLTLSIAVFSFDTAILYCVLDDIFGGERQ